MNINVNTHKSNALSKWAPDYPFLRKDNFYYERRLIQSKPSISREQELTDYNNSLKYLGICRKFNKERVNIVKVFLQKNKSLPNIMNNKESNDSVLNNFMKKQQLKIQREMGKRMNKQKQRAMEVVIIAHLRQIITIIIVTLKIIQLVITISIIMFINIVNIVKMKEALHNIISITLYIYVIHKLK
jgi:hypothetical protein